MSWLVDSLIEEVAVALLWGKAGEGKTWVATEVACSVLAGRDAFGEIPTKEVDDVLYLNADQMSEDKLMKRFEMFNDGSVPEGAHVVHDPGVKLIEKAKGGNYKAAEKPSGDGFWSKFGEVQPNLVIIDSLTEIAMDANDNAEMVSLIGMFREAAKRLGKPCAFIIIHHSRKDGTRPLGASQLIAKIDDEFQASKIEEGDHELDIPDMYRVRRGKKFRYARSKGFEFSLSYNGTATFERELATSMADDERERILELMTFMQDFRPPEDWGYSSSQIPGVEYVTSMAGERGLPECRDTLDAAVRKGLIDRDGIYLVETSKKQVDKPRGYLYSLTDRGQHVLKRDEERRTEEMQKQQIEVTASQDNGHSDGGLEAGVPRCDTCGLREIYCDCAASRAQSPSVTSEPCEICLTVPCKCDFEQTS